MHISNDMINAWTIKASTWLASATNGKLTRNDITAGVDAWAVAHRAGITNEAYAISRDIVDAHIQTALSRIFPNAVFKDAKRY